MADELVINLKEGGALVLTPHPTRAGRYKLGVRPAPDHDYLGPDHIGEALNRAGPLVEGYSYSPADGYPGYGLALGVAKLVGGEAVLPPHPPVPPDATA